MSVASSNPNHPLPQDLEALQQLVREQRRQIEHLQLVIAKLKRLQFGRSSEQLTPELDAQIAQLELSLEELETAQGERTPSTPAALLPASPRPVHPVRRPLPAELPRERCVHEPAGDRERCACGGVMRHLSEDAAEVLEYVPSRFKVIRHVRPKYGCASCQRIVQAPAPTRPIARGLAGPGLLAHVLVSKYSDHLPLYRQSEIYAREGLDLDRSTLADWVGGASGLLAPLVERLKAHVLGADKLHADDTPVPVLSPGSGKTKLGRIWTYVRDDRGYQGAAPPAVWFAYSPDRKAKHPIEHLSAFRGILQADGYAGFNGLYDRAQNPLTEAACWAHARRKFYELATATDSPMANEALVRIGALYEIEESIRGQPATERQRERHARASPILDELQRWLLANVRLVSKKSELAGAIHYALSRWRALTRYRDDGRIEIDNNAAERALRAIALGRKNYLFAGSDAGGERAAALYSLIGTCKLHSINPHAYLAHVLAQLPEHPINRVHELLPRNLATIIGAKDRLAA
jgi:transposase